MIKRRERLSLPLAVAARLEPWRATGFPGVIAPFGSDIFARPLSAGNSHGIPHEATLLRIFIGESDR